MLSLKKIRETGHVGILEDLNSQQEGHSGTLSLSPVCLSSFFVSVLIFSCLQTEHVWSKQSQIHNSTRYRDAGGAAHRHHG